MGFPHLGVEDRWLVIPKRARIAPPSLSCKGDKYMTNNNNSFTE